MDLNDIFTAFHLKAVEYTYVSSAHGTFSRINHMLGHKTSLSKFKKIEIISSVFSDHNPMKLEINHKNNTERRTKTWKLNNMLLNNEWANSEIKEIIKRYLEKNENENTTIQNLKDTGKTILRGKVIALQVYHKNKQKNEKLK